MFDRYALNIVRHYEAERCLRTIKIRNPSAATEVEIAYRFALGDFSTAGTIATASIAHDEAVLGDYDAALTHLERAYSKGWRMFPYTIRYMDPAE